MKIAWIVTRAMVKPMITTIRSKTQEFLGFPLGTFPLVAPWVRLVLLDVGGADEDVGGEEVDNVG